MAEDDKQRRNELHQVLKAVQAFASGIEQLTAKERENKPSGKFGETYNTLLAEAKKLRPNATASLWPPETKIFRFPGNRIECDVQYAELLSFTGMLAAQIEADDLMTAF